MQILHELLVKALNITLRWSSVHLESFSVLYGSSTIFLIISYKYYPTKQSSQKRKLETDIN